MLKAILLASVMTVAVPALAQDMPQQTPESTKTAPAQTAPQTQPADPAPQQAPTAQAAPIPGAPVTDSAPTEQAAAPATPAPADPAATTAPAETAAATPEAAPAAGASQVAQVVSTEFPTYDKNSDKALDKTEFGAWMVALKTASDPATKASDPATTKWVDGAFASADTDKSKSVTQAELTTYLSQGAG